MIVIMGLFQMTCLSVMIVVVFWCLKERYTSSFHRNSFVSIHTKKRKLPPRNNMVVTYNIQRMAYHLKPLWKLQRFLQKYSIILLQECFSNILYDEIQDTFPNFHIVKGVMSNVKLVNSGIVILSRYPILSYSFIPFDDKDYLSSDVLSEKGFLVAELNYHGKSLFIINTHLQSNNIYNNYTVSLKQINQLLSYLRKLEHPFILGGDFNVAYQYFPQSIFTLYRSHQPSIYIQYDKDGIEVDTSSTEKPYYKPFTFDYFVTSRVLLHNTQVEKNTYSDHLPVSTQISTIS